MANPYYQDEWGDESPYCDECYCLREECVCEYWSWHDDPLFCDDCGEEIEDCICGDYPDEPDEMPDFGGVTC